MRESVCPGCQRRFASNDRFCPYCDRKIHESTAAPQDLQIACLRCGRYNQPSRSLCQQCFGPLELTDALPGRRWWQFWRG
jgi:uncharacterized OB-fold protein